MAKFNIHTFLAEVAAPKSPGDKEFVALHPVAKKQFVDYPEGQFKGTTKKDESKEAHPSNITGVEDEVKKEKPLGEALTEGSLDKMSLEQLKKHHKHHHEYGGGSKRSYQALDAIERHVTKKYGSGAAKKMKDETDDYAAHGGSGPVKEETFQDLSEQNLQEISKKVLSSYIKKASTARTSAAIGLAHHEKGSRDYERFLKLGKKRRAGHDKAVDKLAKD